MGKYRIIRIHHAPFRRTPWRKLSFIKMYQTGLEYIMEKHFTPDLLHLHVAYPLGIIALLWKKRYGFQYLLTEHWTIYQPQNAHMLKGFKKKIIVKTGQNAAGIIPVSLDLQRNMERIGIINKYHVIYNLVDTHLFRLSTPSSNEKKQMLHISTLRDEAKNFSGILRTIEQLRKMRNDFELHVIHDYDASSFQAFVNQHGLNDCIFFHGKKQAEEVAQFFAKADCFILFSNFENLPCVIIESFASGVPVISTDVGGIAEIMSPDRGLLIQKGDEKALLEAMQQMLDNIHPYNRQAIRDYAIRTFSNENIGGQIYERYLEVKREILDVSIN